jgi:DNA-binding MarR family transcriptional regulator
MAVPQTDLTRIADALTGLFRAGHASRMHERVAADAGVTIDRTGMGMLFRVAGAGHARVSDLAGMLGLDISTTSRKAQELEAAGLLVRTEDPNDRRASALSLTPEGKQILGRLKKARMRSLEQLLADWSHEDRTRLAELLERLVDDMTRPSQGRC